MFLAIDVGNSQTSIGLLEMGRVCERWRLKTDRADTADELQAKLHSFLGMRGLETVCVDAAAVASVVPSLTKMWGMALEEALDKKPYIVAGSADCVIEIAMPYPTQVGADRIANAVEARSTYGSPAIVVDFGTATNIDVVDARGRYRGGCIAPGLMLSASALFERAAKLANVPVEAPPAAIGDTTEHALQSGLVLGVAAQAEGLVSRIKKQLADEGERLAMADAATSGAQRDYAVSVARKEALDCPVIATGGLSRVIERATDVFDAVDMDLTLRGIWRIWASHQGADRLV